MHSKRISVKRRRRQRMLQSPSSVSRKRLKTVSSSSQPSWHRGREPLLESLWLLPKRYPVSHLVLPLSVTCFRFYSLFLILKVFPLFLTDASGVVSEGSPPGRLTGQ